MSWQILRHRAGLSCHPSAIWLKAPEHSRSREGRRQSLDQLWPWPFGEEWLWKGTSLKWRKKVICYPQHWVKCKGDSDNFLSSESGIQMVELAKIIEATFRIVRTISFSRLRRLAWKPKRCLYVAKSIDSRNYTLKCANFKWLSSNIWVFKPAFWICLISWSPDHSK